MTAGDIAALGGLGLAVLGSAGAVVRWIFTLRSGGDLVTELRDRVAELEEDLKDERKAREDDNRGHREDLDMLRREHKGEIDQLQQEVRRLMAEAAARR